MRHTVLAGHFIIFFCVMLNPLLLGVEERVESEDEEYSGYVSCNSSSYRSFSSIPKEGDEHPSGPGFSSGSDSGARREFWANKIAQLEAKISSNSSQSIWQRLFRWLLPRARSNASAVPSAEPPSRDLSFKDFAELGKGSSIVGEQVDVEYSSNDAKRAAWTYGEKSKLVNGQKKKKCRLCGCWPCC